ncbi:LuxR family transcriptional regulator [Paucibacter soli]|uniref:LuxR family transcriptional regulator n=1 Tax=Paucibacter soli TaxID=3133433 RepID=UPI00309CE077
MLQGVYQSVLEARTRDEFRGEVVRFAKQLGFDRVSATAVVDHTIGDTQFVSVDNCPPSFTEVINDLSIARIDPVMQHCKRNSVPIVWDQATYTGSGAGDLWETQAPYGYRTGICLALHLPEGRHFILGVDRDQDLTSNATELTRLVADLQLFAVHAVDSAMRVLLPEPAQMEAPHLTPREVECLHWTMEGKTAWEVGSILSISERTAVLHINNAMHKLACTNKHLAVLKALRLGLLR